MAKHYPTLQGFNCVQTTERHPPAEQRAGADVDVEVNVNQQRLPRGGQAGMMEAATSFSAIEAFPAVASVLPIVTAFGTHQEE